MAGGYPVKVTQHKEVQVAKRKGKQSTPEQVAEVQAAVLEEVTQGPVEVQAAKPAKLSKSLIEKPVAVVRAHVNARLDAAEQAGEPAPARKELVNELLAMGIAHYTVRTQVQVALSKRKAARIEAAGA